MKIRNARQYQDALNQRDSIEATLLNHALLYGGKGTWQDAVRLDAAIAVYELDHAENHSKRDRDFRRGV